MEKTREGLAGETAHSYNKAILSCLVFEKRITKELQKEMKSPCFFPSEELSNFKKSERGHLCIKLIRKDEEYTQESINDHLKRTHQV